MPAEPSLQYGDLCQCSDEYEELAPVREAIDDFYRGGYVLAKKATKYVPRLFGENAKRHAERIKSGAYLNYFAQITDYFASALFTQELAVREASDAADPTSMGGEVDDEDVYTQFAKNADGNGHTLNETMEAMVITALKQRSAWVHVEMPASVPVLSKADEEALGLGVPYLFEVPHEQIIDWDYDDDGELVYAVCHQKKKLKGPPGSRRGNIRETFEVWRRDMLEGGKPSVSWARYAIEYEPNKKPVATTPCGLEEEGETSFSRIPLLEMCVPDGLWMGNTLCPLAREHYQRRTTLNSAENRSMVAIPVVKLGSEIGTTNNPVGEAQQDEHRGQDPVATFMARGFEVIGKDDSMEFVEPTGSAYAHVAQRIDSLKDEMFRIAHQMAASVPMHKAGAMQRSGESKKEDRRAEALVLAEIGRIVRNFAIRIYETISEARGEDVEWVPHGLDTYEMEDREQILEESIQLQAVDIPSPTFRKEHAKRVARKLVPNMPPATIAKIDIEIEDGIDAEQEIRELKQETEKDQIENPPEPVVVAQPGVPKPAPVPKKAAA